MDYPRQYTNPLARCDDLHQSYATAGECADLEVSALQRDLSTAGEETLALREAHNAVLFKLDLLVEMWAMRILDKQANAF
ncbi:hypothetical protein WJX81_002442 [Elliptochloris bilobata]|uniref:Uncharacterized protein n=1 Tax=Elliptochloris bilobata TaxID=381761 RepID=A0AAW1QHG4_9CHLO